ncbi:MAG TPA: DUF6328 family protein, partial [Actinomycetota bacterium]|nr:DUF6328 family protein [Actinomycetota bacterium]
IELLNELRVALPGVQVLFAFLLTVPFSQRFGEVGDLDRAVFTVGFLATMVSSVLLIAPTAYHRLRWRKYDKERLLETANRLAIGGTAFLALAIACVVFVVVDLLYGIGAGSAAAGAAAGMLAWFWFGLPLLRTLREER